MKLFIISFFFLSLISCNENSLPSITRRISEPPPPTPIAQKDFVIDAEKGKSVFTDRCSRCHGLHDPKEFNAEKWDTILTRMMPRARLNSEEAANVTAYIKANSTSN